MNPKQSPPTPSQQLQVQREIDNITQKHSPDSPTIPYQVQSPIVNSSQKQSVSPNSPNFVQIGNLPQTSLQQIAQQTFQEEPPQGVQIKKINFFSSPSSSGGTTKQYSHDLIKENESQTEKVDALEVKQVSNVNIEFNESDYQITDHTKYRNLTYTALLQNHIEQFKTASERRIRIEEIKQQTRKLSPQYDENNQEELFLSPKKSRKKRPLPVPQPRISELSEQYQVPSQMYSDLTAGQIFEKQLENLNFQFIRGGVSVVWLFIIRNIEDKYLQKLAEIYKKHSIKGYLIPVCRTLQQASRFFNVKGSYFKVVIDLENAMELIKNQKYMERVFSIYVYNNDKLQGLNKALTIKGASRKVRGTYTDIFPLIKRAELDSDQGNKFLQKQGTIQEIKYRTRLPIFMKLSGQDKTQITQYRSNLYGVIKLQDPEERMQKLEEFRKQVERIYFSNQNELQNLQQYLRIDHIDCKTENKQKFIEILRFYEKQSFYYKVLNNMLRISRRIQDFKPITIPFNQTYHAIKYFHNQTLKGDENNQKKTLTLFRGAPLKQSDLRSLKQGNFIQLFGFISTSKNQKYVIDNFIKQKNDYLFIFQMKTLGQIKDENLKKLDHGFVDLELFQIAAPQYEEEQEVLLNALNVYKVTKVITQQQSEDGLGRIYLQYGAIFELYQKSLNHPQSLNQKENAVLQNYRYCIKLMNQIQDQGDVLMKAHEYDKSKKFYKQKLKKQQNSKIHNKLAQAYYCCGEVDLARQHALNSMRRFQLQYTEDIKRDREKCLQIFKIHHKNIEILQHQEDSPSAMQALNIQLQVVQQAEDWLTAAQILRKRGQLHLKQGNFIESQNDLKQSQQLILNKINSFKKQKSSIETKYFLKLLKGCWCFVNQRQIQQQKEKEMEQIQQKQIQIKQINQKIHQLLLKINQNMRQVADTVGDKETYRKCILKGREYFEQLKAQHQNNPRDENPFEQAEKILAEAKVENGFEKQDNITKSYQLMREAIKMVEQLQPMHQKVADYSTTLGLFKKSQYTKNLLIPSSKPLINSKPHPRRSSLLSFTKKIIPVNSSSSHKSQSQSQKSQQQNSQKYDSDHHEQQYQEAKDNFVKAIDVISYHEKQNLHYSKIFEVRNMLGELEYDHSRLTECSEQAEIVLGMEFGTRHSQGAKSSLLLGKVYMSRGQLKAAFKHIQRAHQILKIALIKQHSNPTYLNLYQNSPIYFDLELWKCKIYNRQLNHDLALKNICEIEQKAKKKLRDFDGVGYLADIYEEHGNTLILKGNVISFEDYYQKAINLRTHQMGRYNILNAMSLCTLFKYLLMSQDRDAAEDNLRQSLNIFTQFSADHPNLWVQFASMAILAANRQDNQAQLSQMKKSVKLIQKRYSHNHITYLKLKLKLAEIYSKNNYFDEAFGIFNQLNKQVDDDLRVSQMEQLIESEKDDEKIAIRARLQKTLRETHGRYLQFSTKSEQSDLNLLPKTSIRPVASEQNVGYAGNGKTSHSIGDVQTVSPSNYYNSRKEMIRHDYIEEGEMQQIQEQSQAG